MKLFAVTYTDPSEPWGYAVLDRKLYRTPTEVLGALNAAFDSYILARLDRQNPAEPICLPGNEVDFNSALDYLADEFSREYSVGTYMVADKIDPSI